MYSSDANQTFSSSTKEDLKEEEGDVERVLMSLFSPNPSLSYTTGANPLSNNERNRGGEREDDKYEAVYVSERTMDIVLREMRKMDRDRDRVLHPVQIRSLFSKYKVIALFLNVEITFEISPMSKKIISFSDSN